MLEYKSKCHSLKVNKMLLDQIFTKGTLIVDVIDLQDPNFGAYSLKFDPTAGLFNIAIVTTHHSFFPGNTDKEKETKQKAKRAELASKLIRESHLEKGVDFTIDETKSNLTITANGAHRLWQKFLQSIHQNDITLAVLSTNIFLIPYLHNGDLNELKNSFATMLITGMGRLGYVKKVQDDGGVKHIFYIGEKIRDAEGKLIGDDIGGNMAKLLSNAFRVAIARLIGKDTKEIEKLFPTTPLSVEQSGPKHGIAFELANEDLTELLKQVNVRRERLKSLSANQGESPASPTFHVPMAALPAAQPKQLPQGISGSGATLSPQRPSSAAPSITEPVLVSPAVSEDLQLDGADLQLYLRLENRLNAEVFQEYKDKDPAYESVKKKDLLATTQKILKEATNIKVLNALYNFINKPDNKSLLNIHNHYIMDHIFFWKSKTNSWQEFVGKIREHAFMQLADYAGVTASDFNDIRKGLKPIIQNPDEIIKKLTPFLDQALFSEHRSNNIVGNLFHATDAVKNIRMIIAYCEQQQQRVETENKLVRKN